MKARRYRQEFDNEWFDLPTFPIHKICCCDCGKVHLVEFRKVKGQWQMKAVTDKRATAQRRRHKEFYCKPTRIKDDK